MVCECGHAEYFHRYYDAKRKKVMVSCGFPNCNCKKFVKHLSIPPHAKARGILEANL